MKGELKNRWVLVFTVMLGILFFSISSQAQDTQNNTDSVSYQQNVPQNTDTVTFQQNSQTIESTQSTDNAQDSVSIRSNSTQTTTTVTSPAVGVDTDNDMDDDDGVEEWMRPRAGIKGGVNFSNLTAGDNVTDNNIRTGFHVGVYGQLFGGSVLTIQPEVNFSTKGNRVVLADGVIDQEVKINLSYIDVPVLAVIRLGKAAELHAGFYWAYLVGANIDKDGDLSQDFDEVDRDNFDKWDYGLAGGLGFNLGKGAQIGARYNYGLSDIARSQAAKNWLGDARNSNAQVYLAFNLAAGD